MVCAPHRYGAINAQMEVTGVLLRVGPPAHQGNIQTLDVHLLAATGIYLPEPKEPALRLEDALAKLYQERGIGTAHTEQIKTSAERTCG